MTRLGDSSLDICSDCKQASNLEVELRFELTPDKVHYGRLFCPVCGHHAKWVGKPSDEPTKYKRPKNTTNLARVGYCELCLRNRDQLPKRTTLEGHHVIAVDNGGTNDERNIWTLCTACHRLVEWMRRYNGTRAEHRTQTTGRGGD